MSLGLHNLGRIFVLKIVLFLFVFVGANSISESQAYVPPNEVEPYEKFSLPISEENTRKQATTSFREIILEASLTYGVDPSLLEAIIQVESNFDPSAISPQGAVGLMQVKPSSVGNLGKEELLDPYQNVMAGAAYLRGLLEVFDFDLELALAAYNAGVTAVKSCGGVPPYPQTKAYIKKILGHLNKGYQEG